MSSNQGKDKVNTLPHVSPVRPSNTAAIDALLYFLCLLLVLFVVFALVVYYNYYPQFHQDRPGKNELALPATKYWDSSLPRTSDTQIMLTLDLENVYTGQSVEVTVNKRVICSSCSGTGAKSPEHLHVCSACGGRGYQDVVQNMGFFHIKTQQPCNSCRGKGKSISELCPICHGTGTHMHQEKMTLPIPKGIPEGFQLKIPYGADEHPSYAPGDLYFIIRTVSKIVPEMRRDNNNLHYDLTISLLQSLVGFTTVIPHLVGEVTIQRNEVTIPGQVLVFPNKGMPIYNEEGNYGNLYVNIAVEFPYYLTESEKQGVNKLLGGVKMEQQDEDK